jgi:outer membrane protein TolC
VKPKLATIALAAAGMLLAGCTTDTYRRWADADVYRLLNERKESALGYSPQSVSEPVLRPATQPSPVAAAEPRSTLAPEARDTTDPLAVRNAQMERGPAEPTKRSYLAVPLSPLPPSAPPALELMPLREPWGPLGPFEGEIPAVLPLSQLDPFGPDMAGRWASDRFKYGPPAPRNRPLDLDLFAALRYAVQHNRQYKDQMDELYAAALDVALQRQLLSPRPFARGSLNYTGGQREIGYRSALTATMNAGVRQRLPYGGEIVAETLVDFVDALDGTVDDGESASVALSGTIPLLRGAGMINLEGLISSERDLVYQVRRFEEYRRLFAIDVAREYFNLLAAYQAVNNRRQNLANSISLVERTRSIYAANVGVAGGNTRVFRITFLEVQRSEQQLLDAQSSLIDAQESYLNQLDTFKLLLGMDVRQDIEIVPVALEVNVPDLTSQDLIATADRYRLDLQTARDRIDDARRQVAIAENGLLPDLNLTGRGEIGNRDGRPASDVDSRSLTYSAGVTLDLPIDRRAERNTYRLSLIRFHRSQRDLETLSERVAADVRAATRAIRNSEVSVELQRRSIELAQRRLENANLLLKRGDINARDIVEAQTSLLRAQDSFERARADLQVQVLQFLRQTGTLRVDPDSGTIGKAIDRGGPPLRRRPGAPINPGEDVEITPADPPPERLPAVDVQARNAMNGAGPRG